MEQEVTWNTVGLGKAITVLLTVVRTRKLERIMFEGSQPYGNSPVRQFNQQPVREV